MKTRATTLFPAARLLPILALVLLAVAACAPPPELRNDDYLSDTSLIDGEPCGPPCWRGITPGETDWNDALTIIEDDTQLSDLQPPEVDEETGEIASTFQEEGGIPCCLIYSESGDTLDQMLIQLAPDIELGEVIETHGDPAFLTGTEVSPEQAAAALYYPDLNVIVYAFVEGFETGELSADSEIFAALYIRADDMAEVLESTPLYTWDGYKPLKDYLDTDPDVNTGGGGTNDADATETEE